MSTNKDKKSKPIKQQILKKHVSAIHINAKLSLLQRKLVNALLYNAYDQLLTDKEHTINTALLCEMIGFDSKNIPYLKASLKGLMETVVEFDMLDDDGQNAWEAMVLLPYVKLKGNTCTYSYHRALAEKLYHPDVYSKINLSVLKEMNSTHALVLYENCYRYLGTSHGRTAIWDVDVFRKLMAVDDMASYKQFKALNRNVIAPAMVEVNKLSNIQLELITHRKGRSVVSVQFIVRPNPQMSLLPMEQDDEITTRRAYKALLNEGISKILARDWVLEYDDDYIMSKIIYADEQAYGGRIKTSKSGFLKSAIEQDYKSQKEVEKVKDVVMDARRNKKREQEIELERLKIMLKDIENQCREQSLGAIEAIVSALPEDEAVELSQEFQSKLTNRVFVDDFKKRGWNSRLVFQDVCNFWKLRGATLPYPDDFLNGLEFKNVDGLKAKIRMLENDVNR